MPTLRNTAAALVAALLALAATQAHAAFGPPCPTTGCILDPGAIEFDYTIPPDGRTYLWAIDFTSPDPLATVTLGTPNQREIFYTVRNGAGFDTLYEPNPPLTFLPTIAPGRSTWRVRAPIAFDVCAAPGPDGQVCAAEVRIWGNGTQLTINGTAPITAVFSESLIAEPATWATLLLGFTLTGLATRRRTKAAA